MKQDMKKKVDYRPRIVDKTLSELLEAFGGVLITGPKWCGKSWTADHHAASRIDIDRDENKRRALMLPDEALAGKTPRLIDEWQDAPGLWDAARREIDIRHETGLFIFTGSATPTGKLPSHTGTGRFARLKMRPMTLYESGDSSGRISLAALFAGDRAPTLTSDMNAKKAIELICKGGWPAGLWLNAGGAARIPKEYFEAIVSEDINKADGTNRRTRLVSLLMRSLARNTASAPRATTIKADINRDGDNLSEQSIRSYMDALMKIFVLEEQASWLPSLRSRTRIRSASKRHFTDPSIAAAALGASPELLLKDVRTAGQLFESLCFRDLSVCVEALGGKIYHYRDDSGLEVDNILELPDGRWAAVEVKLGAFEFDGAAKNLARLKRKVSKDAGEPVFLAIMTASGGVAYTRDDGPLVIPVDAFGP
jgi:predicted AAA+ superfamily ATPase